MTPAAARRLVLAACAGLALFLAHPPAAIWPAAFLVVPLLLAALWDARSLRSAFGLGVLAGLCGFGPMIVWLVLPAGYVGWGLLVLSQAVAVGLAATVLWCFRHTPWIVVVAPAVWTGMEAWRATFPLGGFGWGELAYSQAANAWMLPLARLGGARLLTAVVVVIGALVYDVVRRSLLATHGLEGTPSDHVAASLPHAQPALLGLAGVLVVVALAAPEPPPPTGDLDVVAVQGNDIVTSTLPAREEDRVIAANLLAATRDVVDEGGSADLVVWPESGLDRDPFSDSGADLRPLLDEAARLGAPIVTGTILDGPRDATFLNAVVAVTADGAVGRETDRYVKRHLVPFGEYVPFRSVLGRYPALRQVPRDGVPGEGPDVVEVDGNRLAVAICFETLFPRLLRENVLAGETPAGLILATTNDASFGISAEPAQHLAQSRLRAVETGRWVVHASLTGGAAFVDPEGRVFDQTPLFTVGAIRRTVTVTDGLTPFLRVGDVVGIASQLASVLLLVYTFALHRPRTRQDATP